MEKRLPQLYYIKMKISYELGFIAIGVAMATAYKKEGNCSGRSRVRRILLTCIQMLLIQFLEVICSMPKNFAFFQKPLDKFFYKFDNPEINRQ